MTITDRIVRNLLRIGPATARDLAGALKEPVKGVAGALSNLAKQKRVREYGRHRQGKRGRAATIYEAAP